MDHALQSCLQVLVLSVDVRVVGGGSETAWERVIGSRARDSLQKIAADYGLLGTAFASPRAEVASHQLDC